MRQMETDMVVVGSGLAGLATALWLSPAGEVLVLAKDRLDECNSTLAQGGIAAAISHADSPRLHAEDTLFAGAGLCEPQTVELLTQGATDIIADLVALGTHFDLDPSGALDLAREGAHRIARILHHGDSTGAEIWRVLHNQVLQKEHVRMLPGQRAEELWVEDGKCRGVIIRGVNGPTLVRAKVVVLATGGCGQLFGRTTSSRFSTGDGLIVAWRAGAVLRDLEFVQFHPTAFALGDSPLFLISEAVRGEGALLVLENGYRFMPEYHLLAELAPRDIVARAIAKEEEKGHRVFLDATPIGKNFAKRFPTIHSKLSKYGIDPLLDLIPVTPAAHFLMGGIKTDESGRTNVEGLYACGEAASTGVHGANRLASNSLLETLVFGKRVAAAVTYDLAKWFELKPTSLVKRTANAPGEANVKRGITKGYPLTLNVRDVVYPLDHNDARFKEVQTIMWEQVGLVRSGDGLQDALRKLESLEKQVLDDEPELRDIVQLAKLLAQAALERRESRGSHYRSDYPEISVAWNQKHLDIGLDRGRFSA